MEDLPGETGSPQAAEFDEGGPRAPVVGERDDVPAERGGADLPGSPPPPPLGVRPRHEASRGVRTVRAKSPQIAPECPHEGRGGPAGLTVEMRRAWSALIRAYPP